MKLFAVGHDGLDSDWNKSSSEGRDAKAYQTKGTLANALAELDLLGAKDVHPVLDEQQLRGQIKNCGLFCHAVELINGSSALIVPVP